MDLVETEHRQDASVDHLLEGLWLLWCEGDQQVGLTRQLEWFGTDTATRLSVIFKRIVIRGLLEAL
jgi:hypothetical protein